MSKQVHLDVCIYIHIYIYICILIELMCKLMYTYLHMSHRWHVFIED